MQLDPNIPQYCEAYPRLSVGDALRGRNTGKPDILWRNRYGHLVGLAAIDWPVPDTIIVSSHVMDLPYIDGDDRVIEFGIVYKGSTHNNERPYIICDGCTRHIDVVIYGGEIWRCKDCLQIANRSTLIDPIVRLTEQLEAIEHLIGKGRPSGMRMTRFEAMSQRHAELGARLNGRPRRSASVIYQPRIDIEWSHRASLYAHLKNASGDES